MTNVENNEFEPTKMFETPITLEDEVLNWDKSDKVVIEDDSDSQQKIDKNLDKAEKWISKAEKEAVKWITNPIDASRTLKINTVATQWWKTQIIAKMSGDKNLANIKDLKSKKNVDLINKHFGFDKSPEDRLKHLVDIINKRDKEKPIYDNNGILSAKSGKELRLNTYILWVLQMIAVLAGENISVDFGRWPKTSAAFDKIEKSYNEKVVSRTNAIVSINSGKEVEVPNFKTSKTKFLWLVQWARAKANERHPQIRKI